MIVGEKLFTTLKMVCYRKEFWEEELLEPHRISLPAEEKSRIGINKKEELGCYQALRCINAVRINRYVF